MIAVYTILTIMLYLVLWPYGCFRAGRGSRMWQGRLGRLPSESSADIWMHAASVGEVKIIGFMLNYLKRKSPDLKIHVTVVTRQGFKTADKELGDAASVSFFPLDVSFVMRRFMAQLRPRLVAVAETEIWPNMIQQASRRQIPIVLVNGRMSANSFGKYRLIAGSLGRLLACYDRFFFKTIEDADRYRRFGVTEERSEVAGDMKFDAPLLPRTAEKITEIRARCGTGEKHFLLVAGSTRSGEEDKLITVCRELQVEHRHIRLVLAPRHVERTTELKSLLDSAGVTYYTYGETPNTAEEPGEAVVLVDRMGLLNDLYMAADLAFVGGTLVDIGGHNILEPVWAGTPVVYGPSLGNVVEAAEYIEKHNYGMKVNSTKELASVIGEMIVGRTRFAVKTESDFSQAATVKAGKYILERLQHV